MSVQVEELVTRSAAARALRVSLETLRRFTRRGELRSLTLGRRGVRYRRADLAAFIERTATHDRTSRSAT